MDAEEVRKKVTMVFALPIPLPMSIFDNVAYGPRRHGVKDKKKLEESFCLDAKIVGRAEYYKA